MSKRVLRLHQLHSREELVAMLERVTNNPESQAKDGGIHLYNRKSRKLIDDITWAIYWHGAPQGNARMACQRPIVAPDPSRYIITGDTHGTK